MPRVLIGPHVLYQVEGRYVEILRQANYDVVLADRHTCLTESEVMERLAGCDAVVAGGEPYTRRVIETHPQLKVIARVGVGYDAVDVKAATDNGVAVTVSPGNAQGVAEQTFGLMLALAKGIVAQSNAIGQGHWPRRAVLPLRGLTLAVIGLGRIGRATAKLGQAFQMDVIACDPYVDGVWAKQHDVPLVNIDEAFRRGDYVSIHTPLNDETRRFVNRRLFRLMKPSAFLINTARGGIVHQDDLTEWLREGRIAGAGLDVLDPEPPPIDLPLLKLPNVVFTAHTAGVDTRSRDDMAALAAQTIVEILNGGWPEELVVNPAVRSRLRT
jgi:phosphoglycerate dehydrogenase-like enzyme